MHLCVSAAAEKRSPYPEPKMTRRFSNTVSILLGILALCAIPARAQIVSYVDAGGKRVFINANTKTGPD